ncbi:histone H1-delta-like [Haliotis rubra]|uniref:histone H1-delta-like n=1 Tax=Haliotis rubra TaxID=36100 RepID=UPI001EE52CCE|nr:histone H1-delta-like [Haliotis rubra]
MSDAEVAAAPAPASQTKKAPKKKAPAKPKKAASHPKYCDMIKKGITSLKDRGGSSRQAIYKYIVANYKVDANAAKIHLKLALRAGVKNGNLKQSKGTGASGSFRIGDKAEKTKKPKAKKAVKPKAAGAKPKAKKVRKPKAAGVKKSPKKAKKPKAKKPAAAAKPKAAKKATKPKAKKAKTPKKAKAAKK